MVHYDTIRPGTNSHIKAEQGAVTAVYLPHFVSLKGNQGKLKEEVVIMDGLDRSYSRVQDHRR